MESLNRVWRSHITGCNKIFCDFFAAATSLHSIRFFFVGITMNAICNQQRHKSIRTESGFTMELLVFNCF